MAALEKTLPNLGAANIRRQVARTHGLGGVRTLLLSYAASL